MTDLAEHFLTLAKAAHEEGSRRQMIYKRLVMNDIVPAEWADKRIANMFEIAHLIEALAATDGQTALKVYAQAQELARDRDGEITSDSGRPGQRGPSTDQPKETMG